MANEQHLTLLRSGVREWNDWVQTKTTLTASRPRADLVDVDLSGIVLKGANLIGANLQGANLSGADLSRADLIGARLMGANLSQTVLFDANLRGAKLMGANLKGANLTMANLSSADLTSADLERAMLLDTLFANCSLHDTQGLDRCDHRGRSTVDQRTLEISGRMPDAFLRGCGLSDWQIEAAKLKIGRAHV